MLPLYYNRRDLPSIKIYKNVFFWLKDWKSNSEIFRILYCFAQIFHSFVSSTDAWNMLRFLQPRVTLLFFPCCIGVVAQHHTVSKPVIGMRSKLESKQFMLPGLIEISRSAVLMDLMWKANKAERLVNCGGETVGVMLPCTCAAPVLALALLRELEMRCHVCAHLWT